MRPVARSWSTSVTDAGRSPTPWPPRPVAWPTPTAAPSRPNRSRRMPARSPSTCRSTTRRSTRCPAARRRSRRRSSWPARTTWRVARPSAGSSTRGGGAITATHSARWTCRAASRCAGRTRAGSAGSGTSRRPIRIGRAWRAPTPSGAPTISPPSSTGPSRRRDRAPWPHSSPSRSSARPWPPSSRPTGTGQPSPTSAGGTACCSSRTRS